MYGVQLDMNKRRIIWISIGALVVIGVGLVVYGILSARQDDAANQNTSLSGVPDYGACELITPTVVKEVRGGDKFTSIQEGTRANVTGLNGEQAEGCVYRFTTDGSTNNTLTLAVYPYATSADNTLEGNTAIQWAEVSNITPTPYFGQETIDNGETTLYMLQMITGPKVVLLTISQPTRTLGIEKADALTILVDASLKIDFGTLETKAAAEAEAQSSSGLPPPPPEDTVKETITP